MKNEKTFRPDRIFSYFRVEWLPLAFVTLSGLIYNIGLLATPWFEGRLAQCLADILSGSETAAQMALLVLAISSSPCWCRRHASSSAFMSAALPTTSTAG